MRFDATTPQTKAKGPSAWGRGSGPEAGARLGLSLQNSTALALQVYRPSLRRWATVGKLAQVDGELVLGIPYRHRPRLEGRVSLPLTVLRYATQHGATAIIVRFDDERYALRLSLEEALRLGWREMLDGQGEVWLPLAFFEEVPWPDWPWAAREVRLGLGPGELPRQLALALEEVGP